MINKKQIILIVWLTLAISCLGLYFSFSSFFEKENIIYIFNQYEIEFLVIYSLASIFRGLTLIPSTPFIITGTIIFPDNLLFVSIVSLIGILLSATIIYFFSDYMNFKKVIEKKYAKKLKYVEDKLDTKFGFIFMTAWCFFPAVPTDLICYVAGTVKMNFTKYISALFVGELPLVLVYVYGLNSLVKVFTT